MSENDSFGKLASMLIKPLYLSCFLLLFLSACASRVNRRPDFTQVPQLTAEQLDAYYARHVDEHFTFKFLKVWQCSAMPNTDENLHTVEVKSVNPAGMLARIMRLHKSRENETFPAEVVQQMRKASSELAAAPITMQLAEHAASGYRYTFTVNKVNWIGWIVSFRHGQGEVAFLAQYPGAATEAYDKPLQELMRSLRVEPFRSVASDP